MKDKKPEASQDDPEQSKRFIDTARELGVDESEGAFEEVFNKVVSPPRDSATPNLKQKPGP